MNNSTVAISVAGNNPQQPLSAAQKKFNQLTDHIQQQQQSLQQWQDTVVAVQQKIIGQLMPLYDELAGYQIQLIQQLETVLSMMKLSPRQQAQLIDAILMFAHSVTQSRLTEQQARWLEQVVERYQPQYPMGGVVPASDERQRIEQLREAIQHAVYDAYGVDVAEASIDELNFWSRQLDTDFGDVNPHKKSKTSRQKTIKTVQQKAGQQDIDAQQSAEQQDKVLAGKSLKLVYQRLAARLHPDREIDEVQKVRKTALLQEVIHAYQQKDLMTLLQFQHELMQADDQALSSFSEQQFKLYNINLEKHSQQLDAELKKLREQLANDINSDALSEPKQAVQWIKEHINHTQQWIKSLQYTVTHLNSKQEVKTFLQELSDY